MPQISASVLNADFAKWKKWLAELVATRIDRIHWDVMDNKYVPNTGIDEESIKKLRPRTKKLFETHLMVVDPENHIQKIADYGNELAIFHIETVRQPEKIIRQIRDAGMKTGICVNNRTDARVVLPFLGKADLCLVMGVEAGFGGQEFNPAALGKIKLIRQHIDKNKLGCKIEVDGGINPQTGALCTQAGCDILVAGTFIFRHPKGIGQAVKEFRDGK